jgi:hypothetical protein
VRLVWLQIDDSLYEPLFRDAVDYCFQVIDEMRIKLAGKCQLL